MKKLIVIFCLTAFRMFSQWNFVNVLDGYNTFVDLDFINDSTGLYTKNKFVSGSSGSSWYWTRTVDFGATWNNTFSSLDHYGTGCLQALKGDTLLMQWSNSGIGGMQKITNACQASSQYVSTWLMNNYSFITSNYGLGLLYGGSSSLSRIASNAMTPIYNFTSPVTSRLCLTSMHKAFAVCNYTILNMTTDSGFSWNPILTTNYNQNHICFSSPNVGYIACDSGKILKTINAGATWSVITLPMNIKLRWLSFKNDSVGYCGADKGIVFKTFNYGNNWSKDSLPTVNNIRKVFAKNKVVYALDYSDQLFRTSIDSCLIKLPVTLSSSSPSTCVVSMFGTPINLSGTPSGGTFSGPSVIGSVFYPTAIPGSYLVTYKYFDNSKGCTFWANKYISVGICSGVKEEQQSQNIYNFYPNPINNNLYIDFGKNNFNQLFFKLCDVLGRELINTNFETIENKLAVDLSNVSHGIYFIEIKVENDIICKRKIIKE